MLNISDQPRAATDHVIPFEFIKPDIPLITFEAHIGEHGPIRFVLDTGNGARVLLSERLANRLSLKNKGLVETSYGVGQGELSPLSKASLEEISIGELRVAKVKAFVSRAIDDLRDALEADAEGNIGHSLMKKWAIEVDYQAQTLRFDTNPERRKGIRFTFPKGSSLITVQASVNGSAPRLFVLDTGAGGSVLDAAFAKELNLEMGEAIPMLGAAGADEGHQTDIDSLSIHDAAIGKTTVIVAGFMPALSEQVGVELAGIVGYDFLREFKVRIDYKHKTLNFESNK